MNLPVSFWACLTLDSGVLNRKLPVPTVRSAPGRTEFWNASSLGFCGLIFQFLGHTKVLECSAYVLKCSHNVIVGVLGISILLSILKPKKVEAGAPKP